MNTTGGLSPPEKLGLSVTFFLQGRTCQPQRDFWVPYSSLCNPFYLRSLAPSLCVVVGVYGTHCD